MPHPGPDAELVDVWAEGLLDARRGMPWPYKRDVLWLDEIEATEDKLRRNADRVFAEMGGLWTRRLAKALGTDETNVGIGPIAADTTGRRPARTVVTDIVTDLRWDDRRVRFISVELAHHGSVDAAAVPLDNAWVTERVARWGDPLEMLPVAYELPAPGRGFKNFASSSKPASTRSAYGILCPWACESTPKGPQGSSKHAPRCEISGGPRA